MRYLGVGLFLLVLAGCGSRRAYRPGEDPDAGVVVRYIPPGHMHDEFCGHYLYNKRWYYVANHTHKEGCGHHHFSILSGTYGRPKHKT